MIAVTINMAVPAEKRKEVLQTVKAILAPIRRDRGCINCNCCVDVEDENVFYFKGEWKTKEDLDKHLRSDSFGVLMGVMSLLGTEPDIKFNTISATAGAEEIKAARS